MFNTGPFSSRSRWLHRLLGVFLLVFCLSVAGCGVLGGGDDDDGGEEDEGYPEPPGRPNATMVTTAPPTV